MIPLPPTPPRPKQREPERLTLLEYFALFGKGDLTRGLAAIDSEECLALVTYLHQRPKRALILSRRLMHAAKQAARKRIVNSWLQYAPLIVAVIAIASGIGYLRVARMRTAESTINLLKEQISAQALKIASQETELVAEKADNKILVAKLEAQLAHMQIVENLVRGIPAWAELNANYLQLRDHYSALEKTIKALDPVIAVFQHHVDEGTEMHAWLEEWHKRNGHD